MSAEKVTLQVTGMSCAACSNRIEKVLNKMDGVVEANVNLTMERATVRYEGGKVTTGDLIARVERLGFGAAEFSEETRDKEENEQALKRQRRTLLFSAVLSLPFLIAMFGMFFVPTPLLTNHWLQLALVTPIQFIAGRGFYVGAYKALRNKSANMDVLVVLGTSAA